VNTVYGRFNQFSGHIEFNAQAPEQSTVHVVIQAASINTQIAKRDKHLQTADFFDVSKYPELTFESQSIDKKSEGHVLNGLLTIKGQPILSLFLLRYHRHGEREKRFFTLKERPRSTATIWHRLRK